MSRSLEEQEFTSQQITLSFIYLTSSARLPMYTLDTLIALFTWFENSLLFWVEFSWGVSSRWARLWLLEFWPCAGLGFTSAILVELKRPESTIWEEASSRHHQTRERHHRGRSSRVRETTRESESSSRVPPSSSRVPSHPEADSPRPPHTENYRGIIIKIWTSPQRKASISGWIATKKMLKHELMRQTHPKAMRVMKEAKELSLSLSTPISQMCMASAEQKTNGDDWYCNKIKFAWSD